MTAIVFSVFLVAVLWAVVLLMRLPILLAAIGTLAVVLPWGAAFLWRRWKARKAAGQIEEALRSQADAHVQGARPDQQAEIQEMEAEFARAIQALKTSKLGRGGKDALAILPWYMIIGPPGAGKSTALRASGLKFPYLSKRGGVRGIGGTRNCEWWLTNEAVLLDTAGRYATEDEDHDEWLSFLDTVAKARPRKPLNGLIVAVPLTDVAAETEEGAAELAHRMRERVDEVMARLQVVLPVYVLLTKCDLVPGFVETFADLRKADRGQVWGFTVPLGEKGDHRDAFLQRFDELVGVVEERALRRLGEERQVVARERIYEFAQQLETARSPVAAFLESLFTENVYQDTPVLRGVYFTSGTQEGRVVDRVMTAMAQAFGIRPALAETRPVVEAKSYFLRDVFAKVLFPDQHLAFRNARARKRDAVRRGIVLGGVAVLLVAFAFFPLRSFLRNLELIQSTGQIVDGVTGKLASGGKGPPSLAELEPLRERLALLVRYAEEGPPLSMGLGLYRGNELVPALTRLYAGSVRRMLIDPVFRQDGEEMEAFVRRLEATDVAPARSDHARYYDKLRLHLLLTAPRGASEPSLGAAEQEWIGRQVAASWVARRSSADVPASAYLENARLFAKLLAADPTLALPRNEDLVRRQRRVLARLPMSSIAEERLVAEVEGKGYDLTLASVLGGPVAALRSTAGVRGAYTRRAYEEVMKKRLENSASLIEGWVVGGDGKEGEDRLAGELERLRSRYFEHYIDEWKRFVDAVTVERGELRASALLQDLTQGEPPPFGRLFQGIGYNTRIAGMAGMIASAKEGLIDKGLKALGSRGSVAETVVARAAEREEPRFGPRDVERAFAGLVTFGYAPDPPPAAAGSPAPPQKLPLDVYQEQLGFVRDALRSAADGGDASALIGRVSQARTRIESLVESQDVGWRPRLQSWLWPPIEAATSSSRGEATRDAASRWCSAVALPFRRKLAGSYPFNPRGPDAPLADVGDFFRPQSGALWGFYNEGLKGSVERAGEGFRFARQLGGGGFRPELLPYLKHGLNVTSALYPTGAAEPNVTFKAHIRPTPGVQTVFLEVDGQKVDYRNGPEEWVTFTWPGPGKSSGASLRVRSVDNREETLHRDGEWGLMRLLEAGSVVGDPAPSAREFAVAFAMPAVGATVTIDFRPSRSENPFFGAQGAGRARLLEPLRGGPPVPLDIGRGGPPCR
jgi:type VI secretion system protein ImpL